MLVRINWFLTLVIIGSVAAIFLVLSIPRLFVSKRKEQESQMMRDVNKMAMEAVGQMSSIKVAQEADLTQV